MASPSEARSALLRNLWLMALGEPIGLLLRTNDFDRLRQALYAERRKMRLPKLDLLQVRVSPWGEGDLVICVPPQE